MEKNCEATKIKGMYCDNLVNISKTFIRLM